MGWRAAIAALATAGLLAGCGLGPGRTPGAVHLEVTREFGAHELLSSRAPSVRGQETIMSMLRRNAKVTARYGGGFVQSIDGSSGGYDAGGSPIDWFYYVNGVEAPKGAAETNLRRGDRVWWDLHDWVQTDDIPAVVGSFPEPFVHGIEGLRLPVRLECAELEGDPCRTVAARLRAAGVTSARAAIGPAGQVPDTLRVLVGTWPQVRGDPGAQSIERGPQASGVYARMGSAGQTLTLLDSAGHAVRALTSGAGLIAATRSPREAPEWIVSGTDTAGVDRAAHALQEATLHDRFAVALTATGAVLAAPQPSR